MKPILFTAACVFIVSSLFPQEMHVKQRNFTTFRADVKKVTPLLESRSSAEAKAHREYGILPYNAQCKECTELIDERTETSRQFIDPHSAGHTYSQQSYLPLHYKNSEDDVWRTIDKRLKADPTQPGVYSALNQPVPTQCDLNKKTTSINTGELEFEFNKNLSLYFYDGNRVYTAAQAGDYSHYTIGEEGLEVTGMWPGIDMQQLFRAGQIETQYVIKAPLKLPVENGYLVIEDHFSLPDGFTIEEKANGEHGANGFYRDDYLIKNRKGEIILKYNKPIYLDARAYGMHGNYTLTKSGNDYTLQMFVPVSWLNTKGNIYPLYIDPFAEGINRLGNFRHIPSQGSSGNLGFSDMHRGGCDYHMSVPVPGESRLIAAYIDLEYDLTYDNTCGTPPEPAPYCTFAQVTQEVICDSCGTTSGILACNPASPPWTGTCSTDSVLIPGAHAIYYPASTYLSCYRAQCNDYWIPFTLMNRDSICGDSCGYLCARGNMWQMTVEANTFSLGSITPDTDFVCAGQPLIFTVQVDSGAPPYKYIWSYNVFGSPILTDTVYNSLNFSISPQQSGEVDCEVYDSRCPLGPGIIYGPYIDIPVPPYIYFFGDTLISTSESYNQWYRNGSIIMGANSEIYIATQPGTYTVSLDSGACNPLISDPVVLTGLNGLTINAIVTIYPNPATNELIISTSNFQPQLISVYDLNGRKITEQKFVGRLNISALAAGAYFIEIKGADISVQKKFVKMAE